MSFQLESTSGVTDAYDSDYDDFDSDDDEDDVDVACVGWILPFSCLRCSWVINCIG